MLSSPRLEEVTMSTTIERAPLDMRRDAPAGTTRISARQVLPNAMRDPKLARARVPVS